MSLDIPETVRANVRVRAGWACERCRMATPYGHWHHRRSRRVRDQHTHCACNGVNLCATCHRWVHDNPVAARKEGWIISIYRERPGTVPFNSSRGWVLPRCDGTLHFPSQEELAGSD